MSMLNKYVKTTVEDFERETGIILHLKKYITKITAEGYENTIRECRVHPGKRNTCFFGAHWVFKDENREIMVEYAHNDNIGGYFESTIVHVLYNSSILPEIKELVKDVTETESFGCLPRVKQINKFHPKTEGSNDDIFHFNAVTPYIFFNFLYELKKLFDKEVIE